jgi:hypothetical protein
MPTIGQLPAAGAIDPVNDLLLIWQGGVTKAATSDQILTAILSQIPVEIGYSYVFGLLLPGQALTNITRGITVTLPVGLTGSFATCGAAPTNSISLPIISGGTLNAAGQIVGGTQIGTVNFAAGSTVGTFTFTAAYTLTAGTTLGVAMASSGDATFANPGITFIGTRA